MRYSVRAPNLSLTVGRDAAAARLGDALARRARLLGAVLRLLVAILKSSLRWPKGKVRLPTRPAKRPSGAALHALSVDVLMTPFQSDTPPCGERKSTHPYHVWTEAGAQQKKSTTQNRAQQLRSANFHAVCEISHIAGEVFRRPRLRSSRNQR